MKPRKQSNMGILKIKTLNNKK